MATVLFLAVTFMMFLLWGAGRRGGGGVIHTKLVLMLEGDGGASFADFAV